MKLFNGLCMYFKNKGYAYMMKMFLVAFQPSYAMLLGILNRNIVVVKVAQFNSNLTPN